ncbi:MAG: 30S ribosomal protein S13 [Nanoarchaeota archaeon]|nr:30S ribosomal protein S13 [Nanoarchaeota archaeon]|tara:strand:- start:39 stop:512 length:474 start_codon:yes stop_codon:yes gene_type:complete
MPDDITQNKDFRHIVRLAEADLKGEKTLLPSLRRVKGVGFSFANAICTVTNIPINKQVGILTDEEIKSLEKAIKNPLEHKIPKWLYNRKKDLETGEDKHLTSSDLKLQKEFDIKHLKKIKCYRGVRHSSGLPVRGQRTRGNFRHGKTIGVRKKGVQK